MHDQFKKKKKRRRKKITENLHNVELKII